MKSNTVDGNDRRQFLGKIAGGVAAIGLSSIISPLSGFAETNLSKSSENPMNGLNR
jgi:hypothetical protein